jgi:chromosome partitioning protein
MTTISLLNMKGGVGKTTLAVNLAWHLARVQRQRVLLVDLDPQFNASQYLMEYDKWDQHRKLYGTVADILLDSDRPRMPIKDKASHFSKKIFTAIETPKSRSWGFYLLPSELELSRAVKSPQGVEYRLSKALDSWTDEFDYIFLDCAPTDTVLTATALTASDFVLVPMRPDRFSILGYTLMEEVMDNFRQDYPDPKKVRDLGVVFTMVSHSPDAAELLSKRSVEADYVFKTEIPLSKSYLRGAHEGSPVFKTRFARALTKKSIADLVQELDTRMTAIRSKKGGKV